jgi:hypothetical protein
MAVAWRDEPGRAGLAPLVELARELVARG